jgi:hypothetical protein
VLISILEPDAMYIVKNTGTMVIGVAKALQIDNEEILTLNSVSSLKKERSNNGSLNIDDE